MNVLMYSCRATKKDYPPMTQRSILITGCSSGIGLCAATELKKHGWRVFAAARKSKDVEKLAGMGLESLLLDINDSAGVHRYQRGE